MCPISSIQDLFKYCEYNIRESRYLIVLLFNPKNLTDAGKHLLDNIPYLNMRTRDVRFYIPGYTNINHAFIYDIGEQNLDVSSERFDYYGFSNSVYWMENTLSGFCYSEGANLCIIDVASIKNLHCIDFDSRRNSFSKIQREYFVSFDLDMVLRQGYNLNRLFADITAKMENDIRCIHELRYLIDNSRFNRQKSLNVFIAGSKNLSDTRNIIKSEFLSLQNRFNRFLRIYSFEDFEDSFIEGGRQFEYDDFICNIADYVLFILDGRVGGITFKEFEKAVDSYERTGHPSIFVYSKLNSETECNEDIMMIKRLCKEIDQYFTEYSYDDELRWIVFRSFSDVLHRLDMEDRYYH